MPPTDSLLGRLAAIVGDRGLLTGDDVRARKASWLSDEPCCAAAIVRPACTEEVSAVLAACHDAKQPVVPLGGNTGLVEGTEAEPSDIMLSLERMTTIESLDDAAGTMTVQAGVPLQTVQERADEEGLLFPLDLGARGSATIGGAISTNAGGNSVIRYGMMREQVLGLEAVLADGTVLSSMNRMLKNNAGYDLKQLFVGTEGTLGIVTRAVLRLRPAMQSQNTALLAVDDYSHLPAILRQLGSGLGGTLSAFEVLWKDFFDLVVAESDRHVAPVSPGHAFYVLVEARGGDEDGDATRFQQVLESIFDAGLVADAAFAQSGAQRDAMWAIRDDIDGLVSALSPAMAFDVSLPISHTNDYAMSVHRKLAEAWPSGYRGTTFGHLGDGNIHFMLTIGTRDRDEQQRAMQIVYDELRPYGGSISAEHGIGLEKRPFLDVSRNETEIAIMRRLKQALDPDNLLNPGKIF